MSNYSYHHVHLLSTDALAAAKFYETMFDATFTESKGANGLPRCRVLVAGHLLLVSTADDRAGGPATGPHSQMGLDHIGIRVEDMDEAVVELKQRGAEFSVEPREFRPGIRIAFLRAPDGVSVELVEHEPQQRETVSDSLERIPSRLLSGDESFRVTQNGRYPLLREYWQWSASSLLDNTARGTLAEFLVAFALGVHVTPRNEWEPYDLEPRISDRRVKIEVKSSARVQSWKQRALSPIEFNIAKSKRWDPEARVFLRQESCRSADIYVFCTFGSTNIKEQIEAFDTSKWCFYVLPAKVLDAELKDQKTIRLSSLLRLRPKCCKFEGLKDTIKAAARDLVPSGT